jgi:hypothetical protein
MKQLVIAAACEMFEDVYTKDDFVVILFSASKQVYQAVFRESDRILRLRLFPLLPDLKEMIVPVERRGALQQYFGAVNAISNISNGWLKLHQDAAVCCQNEVVVATGAEDLRNLLVKMLEGASKTLTSWWPGIVAVLNEAADPTIAFHAARERCRC